MTAWVVTRGNVVVAARWTRESAQRYLKILPAHQRSAYQITPVKVTE